jgi:hypothetical protein
VALDEFGRDTALAELTPSGVRDVFASDRVTKTRNGARKANGTVDKTRHVLRSVLA